MGNTCSGSSGASSNNAPASATHTLFVKTGDKKGAATNGNVRGNTIATDISKY